MKSFLLALVLFLFNFIDCLSQSTELQITDIAIVVNGESYSYPNNSLDRLVKQDDQLYLDFRIENFTSVDAKNVPIGVFRIAEESSNQTQVTINTQWLNGIWPGGIFQGITGKINISPNSASVYRIGPIATNFLGKQKIFISVNTQIRFSASNINVRLTPPTVPELAPDFGNLLQFSMRFNSCLDSDVVVSGSPVNNDQDVTINAQSIKSVTRNVKSGGALSISAREGKISLKPGFKASWGSNLKVRIISNLSCSFNRMDDKTPSQIDKISEEPLFNQKILQLYPNPFCDQINIRTHNERIKKIRVYNILGEVIYENNLGKQLIDKFEINSENFSEGIYIITVSTESRTFTKKLIKN